MRAEHGQKRAILEPAHIQLAIAQILHARVVIAAPEPQLRLALDEERANIERPVRQPGRAEIEPGGNLAAQCFPGRRNIA